jgi:hypothetical protein
LTPDYRSNHFGQNWTNNHNNGIETQTSSWVYNFNQMESPESMALPTHRRFEEYPENNLQHMSYSMDLNKDHERNGSLCNSRKCCQTLLRLFIWSIIVVSLLGISISIAFIIYIEEFADCEDNHNQVVYLPQQNSTSITTISFEVNVTTIDPLILNSSFPKNQDLMNRSSSINSSINYFFNTSTEWLNISISTEMPNNKSLNTTEISVKEQDLVTNTSINLFNKSLFNSTEEINVEESNEDLMTNKTNFDNNNNTATKSSFPSSTTTVRISPIDLASNDSLHNENNILVIDLETTTEIVLSSTSLSFNESDFSSNGNHSKNLINHSLESNHANSTSFIELEKGNISTTNSTNQ